MRPLCACWLIALSTSELSAQPRADAAKLRATLDTLVPSLLAEHRVPGVSLAIIRNGAPEWSRGYGIADLASRRPVTQETRFNIGSSSKTLTAWGVMALAVRGKIGLDQPVGRYLTRWRLPVGEYPADQVTIRRILSHTAGLSVRGYHGVFVPGDRLPTLEESLAGYSGSDGSLRVITAPGTEFAYSSGGYTLLQLLIEEVSGLRYSEFMRRTLFEPLGMRHSGYDWNAELVASVATPYKDSGEPWAPYQFVEQGSGGLYTTAEDLARFVAAALPSPDGAPIGRGIIPPDSVKSMLVPAAGTKGAYGLGYKYLPVPQGPTLLSHDGSNEGWRAIFFLNSETGDGLVMLVNSDSGGRMAPPIICAWAATTRFDMSALCSTVKRGS